MRKFLARFLLIISTANLLMMGVPGNEYWYVNLFCGVQGLIVALYLYRTEMREQ